MTEPTLEALTEQAIDVMTQVKHALQGLLIEMKGANRRHMDASDFNTNEFKRLSEATERMTAQFEKRK